ncbi:hypothetical protein HK102_002259 [Quaeritorhiza haematococci]|nr:hypothetical protein HK102_002259 [Quaeritorhiza haematococci]
MNPSAETPNAAATTNVKRNNGKNAARPAFGGAGALNPYTGRPYSDKYFKILDIREKLPVNAYRRELAGLVQRFPCTIVEGETGSGKTTQIPQFILEDLASELEDGDMIAITQPRRIAATSVAARVAEEMEVELGEEVGYSVRFDEKSSAKTKLKYMTDGMLLREAVVDPQLSQYSIIILDEAHERTLATDILMGFLKRLCETTRKLPKRKQNRSTRASRHSSAAASSSAPKDTEMDDETETTAEDIAAEAKGKVPVVASRNKPLRLIVMSATLNAEKFSTYFWNAPIMTVPGRAYPVEIIHTTEPVEDYVEASVDTVVKILSTEGPGDILLFLTGEEEIEEVCQRLRTVSLRISRGSSGTGEIVVIPLYSSLPPHLQQRIYAPPPPNGRKIIVSTNIAETSLTIDGVSFVIDPGFSKQKVYNPRIVLESLLVSPISKQNAVQRAGRAGRTKSGKCFRLYTEKSFTDLPDEPYPAILTSNIASVVLYLKKLRVDDLVRFDFITPPPVDTMIRALELLHWLGALTEENVLTTVGSKMAEFPLDPPLTKSLLVAADMTEMQDWTPTPLPGRGSDSGSAEPFSSMKSPLDAMLTIVAMLSVPPVFLRPQYRQRQADAAKAQFSHTTGDHMTLLNVFDAYCNVRSQAWMERNAMRDAAMENEEGGVSNGNGGLSSASPKATQWSKGGHSGRQDGKFSESSRMSGSPKSGRRSDANRRDQKADTRAQKDPVGAWCTANFLHERNLKSAVDVRCQLANIVGRILKGGNRTVVPTRTTARGSTSVVVSDDAGERDESMNQTPSDPSSSRSDMSDSVNQQDSSADEAVGPRPHTSFTPNPRHRQVPNILDKIFRSLCTGFFMQVAFREKDTTAPTFQTAKDRQAVLLHPSTVLDLKTISSPSLSSSRPGTSGGRTSKKKEGKGGRTGNRGANEGPQAPASWIVFHESVLTSRSYVRTVSVVAQPSCIVEVAPEGYFGPDELRLMGVRMQRAAQNEMTGSRLQGADGEGGQGQAAGGASRKGKGSAGKKGKRRG